MKKSNSYFDRAMRHPDPRYRQILERMGYRTRVMKPADISEELTGQPAEVVLVDEPEVLARTRDEYKAAFGRAPYHGWGVALLRDKIEKAKT